MSVVKQLAQKARRNLRSPIYDFHLRHRAYVIQPSFYAPVRPGETLKSALWQARVVSDPLANPLIGWHLEYYMFYVQLQDMVPVGSEDTSLAPLWDESKSFNQAASFNTLPTRLENMNVVDANKADFTYNAYRRIIQEYFREDGETWNSASKMSGALALARWNRKDNWESNATEWGAVDVTINVADGLTVAEIYEAMMQYAMLIDTSMGAVTTFEDYLASQNQGKFSDVSKAYRPELVRVWKEWSYPTNTVNPTDGTPTSAVSFSVQARADKDRFFKEAGFLVGLTVARPKTYKLVNQDPSNELIKGSQWIPIQRLLDPKLDPNLFYYGSQFLNMDPGGSYKFNQIGFTTPAGVTTWGGVYPVEADINANVWKAAASNNIRQDGRLQLNILSDLPPDHVFGAMDEGLATSAVDAEAKEFESVADLANEFLAKVKERKAGKATKLPNVRAALESLNKAP